MFCELHEWSENYHEERKLENDGNKDQRFILMNAIVCGKFLLLDPKVCNPKDLQRVEFTQKARQLEVQQTEDKKYIFTIKIIQSRKGDDVVDEVPGEKSNMLISSIELNPEDIIILQKFVNV